jgi:hypothetical protein
MKSTDLLMLLAAAGAVFFVAKMASGQTPAASSGTATARTGAGSVGSGGATLVQQWQGWKYYSDGTAIDPFGSYYYQGAKVWDSTWGTVS